VAAFSLDPRFLSSYFKYKAILLMTLKVEFFFKCHSRASLPAARQLAGTYIKRPFHGFRVKHGMTFFSKSRIAEYNIFSRK
jgi:hypothetical protein